MSQKPTNAPGEITSRRSFLTTFALGAAAAPLLSLGRSALAGAEASQAPSLCYSTQRVLTSADLQYLGALRVPATGPRMDFSYGQMTGRVVNGQVRLLMSGNVVQGDPIYEFSDPGGYTSNINAAPRMPLVRTWGNIYGTARTTWDPAGVRQPIQGMYPANLYWNESTQLLYWSYYNTYNVSHYDDWCLGASRLNADGSSTAYGPWRPSGGGRKGPWRGLRFAQHPTTGEMLCGTIIQSGAAASPWGPDLWGGSFPTASTPAGFGSPDLAVQKYLTYPTMFGRIAENGSYSGQFTACRRPGDYFFEPHAGLGGTEIDPTKYGGVGSWTSLDRWGSVIWLDLPNVHGVLFPGQLASGHTWYRNVANGYGNCSHGVGSPVDITGPVSTSAYPMLMIYNPADLVAVRAGTKTDYSVDPVEVVNLESRFGIQTSAINNVGSAKSIVGSYFDTASRRLYIAAPEADTTIPGLYNPLVHVFQIL